jgi:mitochondrial import inner membrane translocase subunit TIM22
MSNGPLPLVAPLFPAGKEPLPPGWTEEDRANMMQAKKYQQWMQTGMESCAAKTVIAGAGGTSLIPHTSLRELELRPKDIK